MSVSSGSAEIDAQAGTQKITLPTEIASNTILNADSGATLIMGAPVVVDAGMSLTESGAGSVQFQSTITVNTGGSVALAAASDALALSLVGVSNASLLTSTTTTKTALQLSTLSIASGSTFNLNNNDLVIHGGSLSTVQSEVQSGYGTTGTWTGTGIDSSAAAADTTHLTAVGVILNNTPSGTALYTTFGNVTVAAGDVLVKYTYYGDANLDGKIDGSDYSLIDNGYLSKLSGWYNGDFNYDGVINGSDYTLIDNAFNSQGAAIQSLLASPSAVATDQIAGAGTSAVPEPATLGILMFGSLGLLGRRRSRHLV